MSTGARYGAIEGSTSWIIFYAFLLFDWTKRCKEKLGDDGQSVDFEYTLDVALRIGEHKTQRNAFTSNINDLEYADDLIVFPKR